MSDQLTHELLFANAIDAISIGIEDLGMAKTDQRRGVSAVRNAFSGLLLLYKSYLAEISQDDDNRLIWPNFDAVKEDGRIVYKPDRKRTIDANAILRYFSMLNITIDKAAFERVRRFRNNTEHLYNVDDVKPNTVLEYVVDTVSLARDFMALHTKETLDKVLDEKVWAAFLHKNAIVDNVRQDRLRVLSKMKWFSNDVKSVFQNVCCPYCGCDLLLPEKDSVESWKTKFK